MGYDSKNNKSCGKKFFAVEVDQTFRKVCAKHFVKVTRIGNVMGRKRPFTLEELSFKSFNSKTWKHIHKMFGT